MRTKFLLPLLLVAVLPASAQFRYGVRLGGDINTSALNKDGYSLGHVSGFSGGLTCEYQLATNGLAFDASLLYTRMGVILKQQERAWRMGNDFLQLPVHVKYKFPVKAWKQLAGPFVYTGPSILLRLDSDAPDAPFTTPRWQPGWEVGAGFNIIDFLQISAGYRFGLNHTFPHSGLKTRSDAVNISVSILFDI